MRFSGHSKNRTNFESHQSSPPPTASLSQQQQQLQQPQLHSQLQSSQDYLLHLQQQQQQRQRKFSWNAASFSALQQAPPASAVADAVAAAEQCRQSSAGTPSSLSRVHLHAYSPQPPLYCTPERELSSTLPLSAFAAPHPVSVLQPSRREQQQYALSSPYVRASPTLANGEEFGALTACSSLSLKPIGHNRVWSMPPQPQPPVQPPLSSPSMSPNRSFGEKGEHFQKGRFTAEEKAVLRRALLNYVRNNNLGDEGVRMLCSKKRRRELRGAWAAIAQCLPDRSVSSCYHFCTRAFASRRTGKWTAKEVTQLRDLISKHGRKWTFIGSELNRLPCSCRDKWRLVKKIDNTLGEPSDWFMEEDEALVSSIMKSEPLDIIGPDADGRFDRSWLLIAEKLHGRDVVQCRERWNMHLRKCVEGPLRSHDRPMLQRICSSIVQFESELDWNSIALDWPPSLVQWRWSVLRLQLPPDDSSLTSPTLVAERLLSICPAMSPLVDEDDGEEEEALLSSSVPAGG